MESTHALTHNASDTSRLISPKCQLIRGNFAVGLTWMLGCISAWLNARLFGPVLTRGHSKVHNPDERTILRFRLTVQVHDQM